MVRLILLVAALFFLFGCDNTSENIQKDSNAQNESVEIIQGKDLAESSLGNEKNIQDSIDEQNEKVDEQIIKGIGENKSEYDKKSTTEEINTDDFETQADAKIEESANDEENNAKNEEEEEETTNAFHDSFNKLLQEYVSSNGKVNYAGLKSNQHKLEAYLKVLSTNPVEKNWSRNKKLAYWINTYNAFTIKRILDNFPIESIMDIDNGNTWDVKWIRIGDKTYSLNQIEHEIIRPQFKDERIHFAVNCAAKSCPPLLNKAFTEENVNRYLEKRTVQFINNTKYNTIDKRKVEVSKIFDWYKEDFGDLIDYLNKYLKQEEIAKKAKVSFKEYDWSLNNW